MARTKKQQPIGRLITTRGRNGNTADTELSESQDVSSTIVTRRMSSIREQARKRRARNETPEEPAKRARVVEQIDVERLYFKCPLCTGKLSHGMKDLMNHLVESHYTNPQRYVQRCLERTQVLKKAEPEDPGTTVIEIVTRSEFDDLKETMLDDKNNVMQTAKAKYNLMIEKRREERAKIGTEISTLYVTGGGERERNTRKLTLEQEDEQRALLAWASKFVNDEGSNKWWLGRLPKKGLIDYEGDKQNLLGLARELVANNELEGEEIPADELLFWMKCKLCVYRGNTGDLFRGSRLFAEHVTHHHRISMSFYVNQFLKTQEIYMEHDCGDPNCKHEGLLRAVNAEDEHE